MEKLRELLKRKGIIRTIGVHDVFAALIAEQYGFETIFIGGFGTSASLLGLPDLNFLTLSEMADAIRRVAKRVSVPVVADGDTGHGGLHNVARTVREFELAGASGMILEDQVYPKRCGHFEGKYVVPIKEMELRLKAALKARRDKDFILIARTDAYDVNGLEDAIERVKTYYKTGADAVFIESPHTVEDLKAIPQRVKAPLLVNMLTGGKTPNLPVKELEKMGYKIVVYPIESLLVFAKGMQRLAEAVLQDGEVSRIKSDMIDFKDVKKILGLDEFIREGEGGLPDGCV